MKIIELDNYKMALKIVDNQIYSYDMVGVTILTQSEGILRAVCQEFADQIKESYNIPNLSKYNIEIVDEVIDIPQNL